MHRKKSNRNSSRIRPESPLSEVGEFRLIEALFKPQALSSEGMGVGDDCAFFPKSATEFYAITTDAFIEDVHFTWGQIPKWLGRKALAANLSDLAAKGAHPNFALISWELPPKLPFAWARDFYSGICDAAKTHGLRVIGGNTSSGKKIAVHITLIGTLQKANAKLRNQAKPGQLVCVSGPLGDAAAGLDALRRKVPDPVAKLHFLRPDRIEFGKAIHQSSGVGATMDISDGLIGDLEKLLAASKCRALLHLNQIPLSRATIKYSHGRPRGAAQAMAWALSGGEDYELLFTVDPKSFAALNRRLKGSIHSIGEVLPAKRQVIRPASKVIPLSSNVIHHPEQVIPFGSRLFLQGDPKLLSKLSQQSSLGFDHFG